MIHPIPPKDDLQPWFCKAVLIIIAVLFVARNLPWHLDDLDQAKQAFVSFEMVEEGQWLFQHKPSGGVASKPPLAGWISSAAYLMMGGNWWDGAWRIPTIVCSLVVLGALWKCGNAIFGNNIGGLLAAGAFGLNVFVPRIASIVRTDMMLTLFICLAGCKVLEKIQWGESWSAKDRWLMFAFILASMLTKGPIAYAFLLPGLVAYAIFAWRFGMSNYSWSGVLSWFAPLVFFGGWVWAGVQTTGGVEGEFYKQVVEKEFLGRFTVGEHARHGNFLFGYYSLNLLAKFAPWSLLIIAFAGVKKVRTALREDPSLLWLTCWALGGLLVMELVPSKRFDRILPAVPPLCLLLASMARHLPEFAWRSQPIGRVAILSLFAALVVSTGYAGSKIAKAYQTKQGALAAFGDRVKAETWGRTDLLAVVSGKDEGMLLYTGQTRFSRIEDAIATWRFGRLDYLVLPEQLLEEHQQELEPFDKLAETGKIEDKNSAYVLIKRAADAEAEIQRTAGSTIESAP